MSTLPLPEIKQRLISMTGCQPEAVDSFITELTKLIGTVMASEGSVELQGIGTFRKIELGGQTSIEFAPNAGLSAAVNAPFEMFESVELTDDITHEMLDNAPEPEISEEQNLETEVATKSQGSYEAAIEPTGETSIDTDNVTSAEANVNETQLMPPPIPAYLLQADEDATTTTETTEGAQSQTTNNIQESAETPHEGEATVRERIVEREKIVKERVKVIDKAPIIAAAVVCLLAGLLIGALLDRLAFNGVKDVEISADNVNIYQHTPTNDPMVTETVSDDETTQDDAMTEDEEVASEPEQAFESAEAEITTDTVKPGNFLTTMALRHYGNKKFWVYIYEENREKIANPNLIADNTVLTIAPAEKYDIDPESAESLAAADRKAAEILSQTN